jgi:probable rRNA maturation factor
MPPRRHKPPLQIAVAWRIRRNWRAAPLLRRVARYTAAEQGFSSGQLSVAVVGKRAITTLNERFTDHTGPTDVLTFDLGCDRRRGVLDAEIVLCADVAQQQARKRSDTLKAARDELALYLVHGILHLSGHDDHTPRGFARMHAREDELLSALGLGPVFGRQS